MNLGALLTEKTGPLPNWAWGSVVVVGLGVGIFIMKKQQASAASTDTSATTTATPDSTTAGYDPTQSNQHDVFLIPMGNYQQGGSASTTPTTSNVPDNTVRSSGRSANSHPIPPKQIATIRTRYSINIPSVQAYDKLSPGGVPIRPVPGSSLTAYKAAYGSTIEVLGSPITGPSNVSEAGLGSTSWYPVTGGYISAMDVTGVAQSYSNTVQPTTSAPQPTTSTPTPSNTGNTSTTSTSGTSSSNSTQSQVTKTIPGKTVVKA